MRIETDDARRISHEVGKCIDVVIQHFTVTVVHDVLNATDIYMCGLDDSLDSFYDLSRLHEQLPRPRPLRRLLQFLRRLKLNHRFTPLHETFFFVST